MHMNNCAFRAIICGSDIFATIGLYQNARSLSIWWGLQNRKFSLRAAPGGWYNARAGLLTPTTFCTAEGYDGFIIGRSCDGRLGQRDFRLGAGCADHAGLSRPDLARRPRNGLPADPDRVN